MRQGGWLGMEQRKRRLMSVLVLLQGQSLGLGLDFPGGGGERRPHLGLTEGCSSLWRRRTVAPQQRAVGVWGKKRMEGWSDNLH